jgi:sortase A
LLYNSTKSAARLPRMGKRSDRRKFRRRRQRAGFALFVSLVLVVLGGLLFLGITPTQGASEVRVQRVASPDLAEAPEAIPDLEAQKAAEKKEKAAEEAAEAEKKSNSEESAAAPVAPEPPTTDLYLTVPKMGLYDNYVTNSSDLVAMDNGAIKLPETGFPWQENANTYIAGHVLGYAGTGSYMQFANLPNMAIGDEIILTDANGTVYTYAVSEVLTVTPWDTWVKQPVPGRDMVTLQTCINPPAYDLRLIVRADRVDVQPAA